MNIKMSDSVFTTSFIDRIKVSLDESCPLGTGQCITRSKLIKVLGIDPKLRLESAVGVLVASGKVEGFETRRGPAGGIGRIGERRERKPSTNSVELTDEFKGKLMVALQTLCDNEGTPVPRKNIAAHMGLIEKSLPMISAAIQLDEFDGFETKIGKGGGVRRVVGVQHMTSTPQVEIESDQTEDIEPVTEPVPESNLGEDLTSSMEDNTSDTIEELADASNL